MKRRIFRHEVILVVTAIVLTFLSMSWFMYSNLSEQMQVNAKDECRIMAYAINTYGEEYGEPDYQPGDVDCFGRNGAL